MGRMTLPTVAKVPAATSLVAVIAVETAAPVARINRPPIKKIGTEVNPIKSNIAKPSSGDIAVSFWVEVREAEQSAQLLTAPIRLSSCRSCARQLDGSRRRHPTCQAP